KKVKCPGCAKLMLVAAPPSGPGRDLSAERTVLPTSAGRAALAAALSSEERTIAPKPDGDGNSIPASGGKTSLGARRKGEATQGIEADDEDAALTAFLAPAQGPGEIGRLGGFRILKVLGHGGMGVVFQGEDAKLGRKVAIKAML